MTTLSLEASKKIYELVGKYETERVHIRCYSAPWELQRIDHIAGLLASIKETPSDKIFVFPAPTFAELIRILPRVATKLNYDEDSPMILRWVEAMCFKYINAPTEPEGMKAVEDYLMKML